MNENINAKLTKLLAEHPDLPAVIETGVGFAAVNGCEVADWAEWNGRKWFGRDNDNLRECVRNSVWNVLLDSHSDETEEEQRDRIARNLIETLDWHPCILLQAKARPEGE